MTCGRTSVEPLEVARYTWRLEGVSWSFVTQDDLVLTSPNFFDLLNRGYRWKLQIRRAGCSEDAADLVVMFLAKKEFEGPVRMSVELLDENRKEVKKQVISYRQTTTFFETLSLSEFFKKSDLDLLGGGRPFYLRFSLNGYKIVSH